MYAQCCGAGLGKTFIVLVGKLKIVEKQRRENSMMRPTILLVPNSVVACQYIKQGPSIDPHITFTTIGDDIGQHQNEPRVTHFRKCKTWGTSEHLKPEKQSHLRIIVYSSYDLFNRRIVDEKPEIDAMILDDYHSAIKNESGKVHQTIKKAAHGARIGMTSATPKMTNFTDFKAALSLLETPKSSRKLSTKVLKNLTIHFGIRMVATHALW